jgi:hypothetical protein
MKQSRSDNSSVAAKKQLPKKLLFGVASAATVAIIGTAGMAAAHSAVANTDPKPTSKADCKNGGYQTFGFKNQGQCVAYVEHNVLGHGYGSGNH